MFVSNYSSKIDVKSLSKWDNTNTRLLIPWTNDLSRCLLYLVSIHLKRLSCFCSSLRFFLLTCSLCMCACCCSLLNWAADFNPVCPNISDKHFFGWQYQAAQLQAPFTSVLPLTVPIKSLVWLCAEVKSHKDALGMYWLTELAYCPMLPLLIAAPAQLGVNK